MQSDIIGRRIGAGLLDVFFLAIVFVVVAVISGGAHSSGGTTSVHTGTGGTLVFALLAFAYYYVSESRTGATPAKRILGLRVVDAAGGGQPSGGQVAARTALRIVDGLPFLYLVGFITILATGARAQRIGDIAAKTSVVSSEPRTD